MSERMPLRVRVEVPAAPAPGLLRPAIERRLAGSAFPSGPEDAVGQGRRGGRARRGTGGRSRDADQGHADVVLDPLLGLVPTIVAFQYNPTEITRVLQVDSSAGQAQAGSQPTGAALNVGAPGRRGLHASSSSSTRPTASSAAGRSRRRWASRRGSPRSRCSCSRSAARCSAGSPRRSRRTARRRRCQRPARRRCRSASSSGARSGSRPCA